MSERNLAYINRILLLIAMYKTKFIPVKNEKELNGMYEKTLTVHTPVDAGEEVLKDKVFTNIPEAPAGAHGRHDADGVGERQHHQHSGVAARRVAAVVAEVVARLPEDDTVGQEHEKEVDDDQDREAVVCLVEAIVCLVDSIAAIHCVGPSGKSV